MFGLIQEIIMRQKLKEKPISSDFITLLEKCEDLVRLEDLLDVDFEITSE